MRIGSRFQFGLSDHDFVNLVRSLLLVLVTIFNHEMGFEKGAPKMRGDVEKLDGFQSRVSMFEVGVDVIS